MRIRSLEGRAISEQVEEVTTSSVPDSHKQDPHPNALKLFFILHPSHLHLRRSAAQVQVSFILSLLLLSVILSLTVGSVSIPLPVLFNVIAARLFGTQLAGENSQLFTTILFDLRLPHTALVALTGAALAGSGASYQGLFRNPLADPYLIGVASGAGLGAVLAMAIRWPYTTLGMLAVPAAAFLMALASVFLVYVAARVGSTVPTTSLILAGVALGSFTTALTSYLMLHGNSELRRAVVWLLGGASLTGWQPVLGILPYALVGLVAMILLSHSINVLQFGDEQAAQLGLPVERVRLMVILAASLTTAAAVAFSGVIGFVGLVAPHIVRLVWGNDYRKLIPLSIAGGAVMLLLADVIARRVMAPEELPVGVITALVGGPFFLWVLRRAKQQMFW
jgi:iron complex transport system permease protein